jgi:hypothetical protein
MMAVGFFKRGFSRRSAAGCAMFPLLMCVAGLAGRAWLDDWLPPYCLSRYFTEIPSIHFEEITLSNSCPKITSIPDSRHGEGLKLP